MPPHRKIAELIDPYERRIEYLRISVTDRCDLRCFYCLPASFRDFQPDANWLGFKEIEQLVRVMAGLGVYRVRLTGGEPLTRAGIIELTQALGRIPGLRDLSLSTNATRLAKMGERLYLAGVRRLNVSLDTLQPERFRAITGGKLDKVLHGLSVAKEVGFAPVKINMVAMRGINDDEIDDMIEYCAAQGFVLRLIETMPMGNTGRVAQNHYLDLNLLKHKLSKRYTLLPEMMEGGGPARNYRIAENNLNIGFITPISQHFCATCNRVRVTAEGMMHLCLGQEHRYDFHDILRKGIDDKALQEHIFKAISLKPERHYFKSNPGQVTRFMAQTGG